MISRKLLFNEFNFVITYRYAMNCRLRRQEKRDNLESQVRSLCLEICSNFVNPWSNKIQLEIPISLNISCDKNRQFFWRIRI